jgi:hypothetical protein
LALNQATKEKINFDLSKAMIGMLAVLKPLPENTIAVLLNLLRR